MTIVGSLNLDVIVRVEQLPLPGETVLGGGALLTAGGKGANQAVAAARLGARVALLGCLGRDAHGAQLRTAMRAEGVDDQGVVDAREPTGLAAILVDDEGRNVIAVAPGANAAVEVDDVVASLGRGVPADIVVAQLEVPLPVIRGAASWAREAGVPFVLNASPARTDLGEILSDVSLLVLNESELALLAGEPVPVGAEPAAMRALLMLGPRHVVVTLGARGALFTDAGGVHTVQPFPVVVVDSTGAGDAFMAALAIRWAAGHALAEAVRFACAAGALACTQPGAQAGLPRAAHVERLLAGMDHSPVAASQGVGAA